MRLIDADELVKSLRRVHQNLDDSGEFRPAGAVIFCRGIVNKMPTIDAEPVRHGRWTKSEDDWNCMTTITCSECHEEWCFETEEDVSLLNYRYCPNCGAKMDGGDNDGE